MNFFLILMLVSYDLNTTHIKNAAKSVLGNPTLFNQNQNFDPKFTFLTPKIIFLTHKNGIFDHQIGPLN